MQSRFVRSATKRQRSRNSDSIEGDSEVELALVSRTGTKSGMVRCATKPCKHDLLLFSGFPIVLKLLED